MSQPNVVTAAPAALWEDFIDIFVAPANVFRRREQANWFVPLVIVTLAIAVISFASRGLLQPVVDATVDQIAEQMRKNPQITEDMIDAARGRIAWFTTYGPVIFIPILIVLTGLMTWLVGKVVDARETVSTALVVAAYANAPRILGAVASAIQGFVMSPDQLNGIGSISLGPARFMNPATANPLLFQLALRLDIPTIWVTVLLAIGCYAVGRVTKGQAAVAGVLFWMVGSIQAVFAGLQGIAARS